MAPTSDRGPKHFNPHRLHAACKFVALARVASCKLSLCTALRRTAGHAVGLLAGLPPPALVALAGSSAAG
eukprot:scaffold8226_cov59-Phaeocystis_antarctica.AAC.1